MRDDPFQRGEDAFLARLARAFGGLPLPRGALGIGDDAAVLPGRPVRVVTLDLLVEGQHFEFGLLSPEDLAARALEVNLSDIAAMGARPEAAFLGLAWPASRAAAPLAARFLAALRAACLGRRVPLLGGDTVRAAPGAATLALTVCGIPWPGGPVLRSGGRPGDVLAVTGTLGGSGLGLAILRRGRPRGAAERDAVRAFRTPRARLEAARPLARAAHALMDVSDGLGLDLPRLARASGCGFEVEAAALPLHPGLRPLAPEPALRAALAGGEDYELLAALPPRAVGPVRRALSRHGLPLSVIGRLLPARSGGWLVRGGRRSRWPGGGWDPFARDRDPGLDRPPVLSVGRDERDGPPR